MAEIHINNLGEMFSKNANKFKRDLRRLHEEMAPQLKKIVDENIDQTINDNSGRIKGYQASVVGSRGGYAAIKPIKGGKGNNRVGAITNYLEYGHKLRKPREQTRRYKRRVNVIFVSGRYFYKKSEPVAIDIYNKKIKALCDKIADELR